MSLTLWVGVNDRPVAFLAVRRTSNTEVEETSPDAVNSYEVRLFDVGDDGTITKQRGDMVEICHTFGDGALHLAHLALSAAMSQK